MSTPEPASFRYLQVEPTTRCNFTCGFCTGRHMRQGDLSPSTFQRLLDEMPGLEHIELQGEGEPLMHGDFFAMVASARARGIRVSIVTNGSYFSPQNVTRLLDADLEAIFVSIESPDPVAFREIRGGKLEKVLRGLQLLIDERDRRGLRKPNVGLSVVVLKRTRTDIVEIASLYKRLRLDAGAWVRPLSRMPGYTTIYDEASIAEMLDGDEECAFRRSPEYALATREIAAHTRAERSGFFDELGAQDTAQCPWLTSAGYVNIDGEVMACCRMTDGPAQRLGVIGETPLAEIVARRRALAETFERGDVPGQCSGCAIADRVAMFHRRPRLAEDTGLRVATEHGASWTGDCRTVTVRSRTAEVELPGEVGAWMADLFTHGEFVARDARRWGGASSTWPEVEPLLGMLLQMGVLAISGDAASPRGEGP
jgi:MoaA/NifB/PqqE/SkfB family radical SAM enzyme